ncbi:streptophobe family protein [Kitasatospora arboriphila]|uniref:Streptophobe family protein n=2 Tax=Kitasatospora TaxID=2063 RepID=A0ABP4ER12_9ACTN
MRTSSGPGARTSDGPAARSGGAAGELRHWGEALTAVVAAVAAMLAVAAIGLYFAGANDLPSGGYGSVVAATVLMACGASARVEGGAAFVAGAKGGIEAVPLSVSLTGALLVGWLFLRPMRLHATVSGRELLARVGRVAVLWALALLLLSVPAEKSFVVSTGEPLIDELGGLVGASPTVGFAVDTGRAVGLGLVWLAVVLLLALAVSRRTPLPLPLLRFHTAVRPAAHAVLTLLLVYVALALPAGLVEAAVGGHARQTLAVVFLGLPNLAWLALGIGMGGAWHGHVAGTLGLPMPQPLAGVLQQNQDVRLDAATLTDQDSRTWLLVALAVVALLFTGLGMAMHAPPGIKAWRHAVHLAVALAVAMLLIGVLTRISAAYGLTLLGFGGSGAAVLEPDLLVLVAVGAVWGAVAGLLGGLTAARVRRDTAPAARRPAEPGDGGPDASGAQSRSVP